MTIDAMEDPLSKKAALLFAGFDQPPSRTKVQKLVPQTIVQRDVLHFRI